MGLTPFIRPELAHGYAKISNFGTNVGVHVVVVVVVVVDVVSARLSGFGHDRGEVTAPPSIGCRLGISQAQPTTTSLLPGGLIYNITIEIHSQRQLNSCSCSNQFAHKCQLDMDAIMK